MFFRLYQIIIGSGNWFDLCISLRPILFFSD